MDIIKLYTKHGSIMYNVKLLIYFNVYVLSKSDHKLPVNYEE